MNQKLLSAEYFNKISAVFMQNNVILVFTAVFSSFILRLFFLNLQSFSIDEAALLYIASFKLEDISIAMHECKEVHPLGYFLFAHIWSSISDNEIWLRFSSLIFSCLSVFFIFKLVKELSGSLIDGFIAAMLLALSPFDCIMSSEFRMYPLLELLFLLSMIYSIRLSSSKWDTSTLRNSLILFIIDSLGACIHFLFIFAIFSQILIFIYSSFKRKNFIYFLRMCLNFLGFFILFFIFFSYDYSQDMGIREKIDIWHLLISFSCLFGGSGIVPGYLLGIMNPWLDIRIFIGFIGLFASIYTSIKFFNKIYGYVIYCLCFIIPVFFISFFDIIRIFEYKYFISILPCFICIISFLISHLRFKKLISIILISLFLISSISFICLPCFRTADWKETASVISSRVQNDEVVIICPSMASLAVKYYMKSKLDIIPVNSISDVAVPEGNAFWICAMPFHPICLRQDIPFCIEKHFIKKEEWRMKAHSPSDEILIMKFGFN